MIHGQQKCIPISHPCAMAKIGKVSSAITVTKANIVFFILYSPFLTRNFLV
jgi:hypothetical protein